MLHDGTIVLSNHVARQAPFEAPWMDSDPGEVHGRRGDLLPTAGCFYLGYLGITTHKS